MWYIFVIKCYSAIKRIPFAAIWTDLEIIILSEVSQIEKGIYDIAYIRNLKKKIQMNLFTKQKQIYRYRKHIVTKG